MNRHAGRARRILGGLLVVVLALLVVRLFFFGVFRVEKRSMMPTLRGSARSGDVVLVRFARAEVPRRFDLVVIQPGEGERPIVKRAVALPGEKVEVRLGDLRIDGERLAVDAPRPAPVALFDDRLQDVEHWFDYAREAAVWSREGAVWHLDSRAVPVGTTQDRMYFARRALDGWVDEEGGVEDGLGMVNDLVLDLEVRLDDPPARLRLGLLEMGDIFELEFEPQDDGGQRVRLQRRWVSVQGSGQEVLLETQARLEPGRWHALRFLNVDDQVALVLEGRTLFLHAYAANHFHPQDEVLRRGVSLGARAWFGGLRGRASFRSIRLSRDLHYTARGERAVTSPLQLGPEQVFVLGDNSAESLDSRDFGPVPLSRLLGRPTWVLWPPSRMRRLQGPEPLVSPR